MQVVLADDHAMVREALKPIIERVDDDISILEAENFDEAMKQAQAADDLGLIVLDLLMPGMNDVVGLKSMRAKFADTPIVILSGVINRGTIMGVFRNGADGFIPKTYGGRALINALRLVLSGEKYVPSSAVPEIGLGSMTGNGTEPTALSEDLSPKDKETLALLKEGYSNKEIARILNIREVTVKKRLGRIYRKLGVSNRTQATKFALESNIEI